MVDCRLDVGVLPDFDQRLAMAMCVGYFDGTATGNPASFTVAGYVSSKARWREFEARWSRTLRREALDAFNARDFLRRTGEFAIGWDDDAKRRGLIEGLGRVIEQHIFHAFSCSVLLEEYEAIDEEYAFNETAARPYGLCTALVIANVRRWMAAKHRDDLTLFVFEQGDIDPRQLRGILRVERTDQGEPAQFWPREWIDERGRPRYLRPLEACGLFAADQNGAIVTRLLERSLFDREIVDRARLLRSCEGLKIPLRSDTSAAAKRETLEIR